MNTNGDLPKTVNVRDEQGNIRIMPYKELKQHEEWIIEDNIGWGYLHGYTNAEIKKIQETSRTGMEGFKKQIKGQSRTVINIR